MVKGQFYGISAMFGRATLMNLSQRLVRHAHADCHLLIKIGGSNTSFNVADCLYPLDDQNVILVNAWDQHAFIPSSFGQTVLLVLYLRPEWLSTVTGSRGFTSGSLKLSESLRDLTYRLGNDLSAGKSQIVDIGSHIVEAVRRLISEEIQQLSYDCSWQGWVPPPHVDYRIKKALLALRNSEDPIISSKQLASAVGLSRPHLFELFRDYTGLTPKIYQDTVRTERAIEALIHSDLRINEIALDLGFSAPSNFARFFLSHVGVTPQQFRDGLMWVPQ